MQFLFLGLASCSQLEHCSYLCTKSWANVQVFPNLFIWHSVFTLSFRRSLALVGLDIVPIKCSVVQVIVKLGQVFCVLESGGFEILKAFCLMQSENLVFQKLCQIQSEPLTNQMLCLIQSLISLEQQNQSANIIHLVVLFQPQQWTSDHPAGLAKICYMLCCPGLCSNW
jgi:hypothetical protein